MKTKKIILHILLIISITMQILFSSDLIYASDNDIKNITLNGSGTEADPYLISTVNDLKVIQNDTAACYKLTNDIEFDSGDKWELIDDFSGELDGEGFAIIGLNLDVRVESKNLYDNVYYGMFKKNNGVIHNIKIVNSELTVRENSFFSGQTGYGSIGVLAGFNSGIIKNIIVENAKLVSSEGGGYRGVHIGIITGASNGILENIGIRNSDVSYKGVSSLCLGGIAGGGRIISECYVSGGSIIAESESSDTMYVGGIVGETSKEITDCYNTTNISISGKESNMVGNAVGGIAGRAYGAEKVIRCLNLGALKGDGYRRENIAAITTGYSGVIQDCYYADDIIENVNYTSDAQGIALKREFFADKTNLEKLDFNGVWVIDTDSGIPYPQLYNNMESETESVSLTDERNIFEIFQGEEFALEDSTIAVTYKNGNTGSIKVEPYMLSEYDNSIIGEQNVFISYGNSRCTLILRVKEIEVLDISFETNSLIMNLGTKYSLNVNILPDNATNKMVNWTSSDNSIVDVDENGTVLAKKEGKAVVKAISSNGLQAECEITVELKKSSLELNRKNVYLNVGDSSYLSVISDLGDTYEMYTWSTSDSNIVTVSQEGFIVANGVGECIIEVSDITGSSAFCTVCVVDNLIINSKEDLLDIGDNNESLCILNDNINLGLDFLQISNQSNITLDLNGHTITGEGESVITNNGNLKIVDSFGSGLIKLTGKSSAKNYSAIRNNFGSILTIDTGKIQVDYGCSDSLNIVIVSGIYNYGYISFTGGDIIVSSSIDANKASQQVYGVFNNENGILSMSGGNIELFTKADAASIDAEISTTAYGILNQTDFQLEMTGGRVEVQHDITSNAKKNIALVSGVANNSSKGSISIVDGIIESQLIGNANCVSGGVSGICNLSNGMIYFDGGHIDVRSHIIKELAVAGIMNNSIGKIIVGNSSNASNSNPSISTESDSKLDIGIAAGAGEVAVRHGAIEAEIGIDSEQDIIIGTNNNIIKSDDLYIEGRSYIFLSKAKINIYDGTFSGGINLTSQGDVINIPKGYTLDGIKDNRISNGTLNPIIYTIIYKLNGGINDTSNPNTYNIANGKIVLAVPTKVGYKFRGWYTDSQYINKINEINCDACQNIVLYAKWEKNITDKGNQSIELGIIIRDFSNNCEVRVTSAGNHASTVSYIKPINTSKTIDIPKEITYGSKKYKVTSIASNAFKNNRKITKVTIGSNVISIGSGAFYGCTKLKKLSIGVNVTTIGDRSFYKCTALTKIIIPTNVSKIGKQAFYGCKKLKSITIKTTELTSKKVGSKAFKNIKKSATIKVPVKKLSAYKKLLKKKGIAGKKQQIKK